MPDRNMLRARAAALRAQIAELDDVIREINTPASYGQASQEKRESLKTVRGECERELEDLQAQLASND